MPDTFHSFPLLPRELREMIWELAVRPAVPGAHIFSTYCQLFNYTEPEGISSSFQAFIQVARYGAWVLHDASQRLPHSRAIY
ncbi:hypothetical protein B0T25DRAFT_529562 [Lasiosphaeria hispida]|uniref:2EXR domain-containing protein n=1 Tax=Lasiosphaeria hispida TaxID=260671 RepID=A0AAJ0HWJ3_9PEZI|nr:hypothetical protein B0T25DRAFT_529562 [Lasiosphaeria hispida]